MSINLLPDDDDLTLEGGDVGWRIPLSIHGLTSQDEELPQSTGGTEFRSVQFIGEGIFQNTLHGDQNSKFGIYGEVFSTGPDHNLCGSLTYRNSFSIQNWKGQPLGEDQFVSFTRTWTSEIKGGFNNERLSYDFFGIWRENSNVQADERSFSPPAVIDAGVPDDYRIGYSDAVVKSESSGIFEVEVSAPDEGSGEGKPYRVEFGAFDKSEPVTSGWLKGIAAQWLSLSFEQKHTLPTLSNSGGGLAADLSGCAALTDSEQGYFAGASALCAYGELDLSEDTVDGEGNIILHGYKQAFQMLIPTETRKNVPFLQDTLAPRYNNDYRSGLAVFNQGNAEISLSSYIEEDRFRDDLGAFDPGEEALEAIGWGASLAQNLNFNPGENGFCTSLQFLSADGADYQLSLTVFYTEVIRDSGSNVYIAREVVHGGKTIRLGQPLVIDPLGEGSESWAYDRYEITAISRRPAGAEAADPFVDILESVQVRRDWTKDAHLLETLKNRAGSLWGFAPLSVDEGNRLDRFSQKSLSQGSSTKVTSSGISSSLPETGLGRRGTSRGSSNDSLDFTQGATPQGELPPLARNRSALPENPPVIPDPRRFGPPSDLRPRDIFGPPSDLRPREIFGPPRPVNPPSPPPIPPARPALPNEPPVFDTNRPPVFASRRLLGGLRA